MATTTEVYSLRLSGDLKRRLDDYQTEMGFTDSQALRTLISLGLGKTDGLDKEWAKAVLLEANTTVLQELHKKLQNLK